MMGALLPDVPAWATALMLAAGVLTACLTTALGAGGGVLLLGVMSLFLPVTTVLPLHGAIQAGANGLRTALLWRHVQWPVLLAFAAGAVPGAWAGSRLLAGLSEVWLELGLGAFILWACWGPMPRISRGSNVRIGLGGAVTSALTLFVGATGPVVAAFLRAMRMPRLHHMGTFSACMVLQHALKIAAFGLIGFAFGPYLPFLGAMLLCSLLGTGTGRLLLGRLDDRMFHRMLAVVLTLLALRLLYGVLVDALDP